MVKPKLFESLMQSDGEFRQLMENLSQRAATHPFLRRYCEVALKERLFSDTASALGHMHDTLVEAAYPEMIGREIIMVRPTTEAMERFPLDEKAVAYRYAEGAYTRLSGKKVSTWTFTLTLWLKPLKFGPASSSKTPLGMLWKP